MSRTCRFCKAPLNVTFADLGMSPISNDFVPVERAQAMEPFYPLHAFVCESCFLVQLIDFEKAENMFSDDYALLLVVFRILAAACQGLCRRDDRGREARTDVDGRRDRVQRRLSSAILQQAGIPVLGVEPTANTARVALDERGVPSEVAFFGSETARRLVDRGIRADVMAANNVLAHVPDINDFVSGYPILLKADGVANVEFPHLLSQIENRQFDTIYHEHFSYLSFTVARRIFAAHRMRVYDAAELTTHGGSLRLFICHDANGNRPDTPRVAEMLERERRAGLGEIDTYRRFSEAVVATKCDLLDFLVKARRDGKSVVGYGAPAKGNTLLNYCGVRTDLVEFTVDRSPHKVGKLLPGVRLPIRSPEAILERRPDYVLILPWNLKDEVMQQMSGIREWGGRFVTPIPTVQIHP